MTFSNDPAIDEATIKLASLVTTHATTLQADSVKLTQTITTSKLAAAQFLTRSAQLKATAPTPTSIVDSALVSFAVSWIDQVITWLKDLVSWAHDIDLFGWLNWFINDIDGAITDLQNLANSVQGNVSAINAFGTVIADVLSIIGWVETLLSWF